MLTKRKGSLLFLIVLAVNLLFFVPLEVKAIDNNYWNLDFNSNIQTYILPNAQTFSVTNAHWKTTGYYVFNESNCRMKGYFKPIDNIINYTFSIRFYHSKYKDNAQTQLGDKYQCLFRLGTYNPILLTPNEEFLTIIVGDADTDNPYLQMKMETMQPKSGAYTEYKEVSLAGGISNDVWHILIITYCFPNQKVYVFLDGNYWSSEILSRTGSWIFPSNYILEIDVGAWLNGFYSNWFCGGIDYIKWASSFTSSYTATQIILWYHFDDGTGAIVSDSSGNNLNGILQTQNWIGGVDGVSETFGYSISGPINHKANYFAVNVTSMPDILERYTASYYLKWSGSSSVVETVPDDVYLKPFKVQRSGSWYSSGTTANLIFKSTIGGTERTLTSSTLRQPDLNNKWLYVFIRYNGNEFRASLTVVNNMTTFWNSSVTCSGTVTQNTAKGTSSQYWGFGFRSVWAGGITEYYDEFKLTTQVLGPWQMNATAFGTPQEITVVTPYIQNQWLKGNLEPSIYYLTPTNPTGTGTLMLNSSGQFTIRMRKGYEDLYKAFDISGFNATEWSLPAAVYYKTISFTMKNNTPSGTYFGQVNVTNSEGVPNSQFFGFTLVVSRTGEFINKTFPITLIVKNSPLTLRWDDIKTGQIYIFTNQSSMLCDYSSEYIDMSVPKWDSYKSIFDENDYVENLRDSLGNQYFKINYAVDNRILNYGNLTIYHYVRICSKNNPEIYTILTLTINVQIKSSLYSSDKLWITLSTSSVTGKAGEIKQVTLSVFSNKIKFVYWTPSQSYDSIRPEYVFVTGDNYKYTNYSVILSVRIPQSCEVSRTVTMRVFEVYNPLLTNQSILTVNGIPTGADFSFSIIPLEGYLDALNQKFIFRATITNNYGEIDSYFLNAKWNITALVISIGGTSSKPWFVGKNSELVFDIHVIASDNIKNGSYQIQFTAYTYNASNYVSKSVIIYVTRDITGGTGRTDEITPITPIAGTNLTLINIGDLIQVTGLGSGAVKDAFTAFSELSGMPIGLSSFLLGLVFVIVGIIGTALASKGLAPSGAYILVSLGVTVFNTMAGIWDMWILMIFVLIGIVMLSTKIIGHISGNKEGENA